MRKAKYTLIPAVIAIVAFAACVALQDVARASTPITAVVVGAQRAKFPDVKLYLSSSSERATMVVRPAYSRSKAGRLNLSSPVTQRNMVGYYLVPGDRISADLLASNSKGIRSITNIRRLEPGGGIAARRLTMLTTDRTAYPTGVSVRMRLTVTGTSNLPATFNFSSGQQYDFWVTRQGKEVWRWSNDRMFTQALTSFTVLPNQSKSFVQEWNQKDNDGNAVPPGEYVVLAQLTTTPNRTPPESKNIYIGAGPASAATISAIRARPRSYTGKMVSVSGVYYGWRAPQGIAGCDEAPPVTRSDWVVSDGKACIYVTGPSELDPVDDRGKSVVVLGEVKLTAKGQAYLRAEDVKAE